MRKSTLYIYISALCLCLLLPAHAQRVAVGGGYQFTYAENLNNAIDQYNFSNSVFESFPRPYHGAYANLDVAYPIWPFLFVGLRGGARYSSSVSSNLVYENSYTLWAYEAVANIDVYLLAIRSRGGKPPSMLARGLYLSLFGGGAYLDYRLIRDGTLVEHNQEPFNPTLLAPIVGAGIGFDFFTAPFFSITPEVRFSYHFPINFPNLTVVHAGTADVTPVDESDFFFVHGGIQFRFYFGNSAKR